MGRPRLPVLSYRKHKQSGQAVVTLTDGLGNRQDVLLGRHDRKESRVEYARVIAEWEAAGQSLVGWSGSPTDLTINELILDYCRHVARQHGPDDELLEKIRCTMPVMKQLYGHTSARKFGPLALKSVQQRMIADGLCRSTINRRVGRSKSMFRWAESEELLPPSTLHALETVKGLVRGRCTAKDKEPVKPVPAAWVEATLPFLSPTVADMVRVQQLTGMRSGELTVMRSIDIDLTGKVWLCRPGSDRGPTGQHKTAHHGHQRILPIGPRGQKIVRKYLQTELQAYLFSPQAVMEARSAAMRRQRKTPVQPSQRDRRKRNRAVPPGPRYTTGTYRQAIERGIAMANRARACEPCKKLAADRRCAKCQAGAVPGWHPHQLRHAAATEIRREAGLDAARAVLGHRSPAVTETCAELDIGKAADVMERLG